MLKQNRWGNYEIPETMTPEDALIAMGEVALGNDREYSHIAADDILCAVLKHLGHDELVEAFHDIEKWYA